MAVKPGVGEGRTVTWNGEESIRVLERGPHSLSVRQPGGVERLQLKEKFCSGSCSFIYSFMYSMNIY